MFHHRRIVIVSNENPLYKELENQLEITIQKLEEKYSESGEQIIDDYLNSYKSALSSLKSETGSQMSQITLRKLRQLLSCARGYMEVSSDYMQEFLGEMGKSEKLIKAI